MYREYAERILDLAPAPLVRVPRSWPMTAEALSSPRAPISFPVSSLPTMAWLHIMRDARSITRLSSAALAPSASPPSSSS